MNIANILKSPVITEKSLKDAGDSWYTFKVNSQANKNQIAEAVEKAFSVHVETVKTLIVKGKSRRIGRKRQEIKLGSFKKALVRLKKGEKINVFEEIGGKQ